jgi:hypothetical protein
MCKAAEERLRNTVSTAGGSVWVPVPLGTSIPYLGREYKVAGGAGEGALTRPETVNIDVVVHHHVQQVLPLLRLK